MKSRHILVFAFGVFVVTLLLATVIDGAWLRGGAAQAIVMAEFLVVLLLAFLFAQTAVACLGMLAALSFGMAHYATFLGNDARMLSSVIFTASLYIPLFSTFLAEAPECPPFSKSGALRFLLAASFLPVCLLVYAIMALAEPPNAIESVLLHGMASWLPVPLPGFLACSAALAYLCLRGRDPSDRSHWFAASLALVAVALGFRSSVLGDSVQPGMLMWSSAGAMLVLIGAALDAGWRHANMDELTQLPSRRPLHNHMQRLQPPYVLAVIDIDHFKSVNDRFGHDVGDQVLRFVASRLREVHEVNAVPYRYGGEEFVIVLPWCDAATAHTILEDLRRRIEARPFVLRAGNRPQVRPEADTRSSGQAQDRSVTITVSIGFAAPGKRFSTPSDVLLAADKALYQAKAEGRNRVVQKG